MLRVQFHALQIREPAARPEKRKRVEKKVAGAVGASAKGKENAIEAGRPNFVEERGFSCNILRQCNIKSANADGKWFARG